MSISSINDDDPNVLPHGISLGVVNKKYFIFNISQGFCKNHKAVYIGVKEDLDNKDHYNEKLKEAWQIRLEYLRQEVEKEIDEYKLIVNLGCIHPDEILNPQ